MEKIKISAKGPIAEKVIRVIHKIKNQKIVDFNAWQAANHYQHQLKQERANKDFSELDPLHALYMDTQHRISEFMEQFSLLPESHVLNQRHDEAEDLYLPSGPPMSPLTRSYFFCWAAFDMSVGIKRETYTTIMLDIHKALKADSNFIQVVQCMQESRMGLYRHQSFDGRFVYLRELYTNKLIKTHVGSRYNGVPGEIWLVRLLPDPFGYVNYSVAFTTPYVIIRAQSGIIKVNQNLFYPEEDWIEFIKRNLAKVKVKEPQIAYEHFMKYGLSKHYWPEYITEGYANHTENLIWLTGFPDKPETLPHSKHYRG